MPPTGDPLTKEQIADFEKWIGVGAVFPQVIVIDDGSSHWAFQPVRPVSSPGSLNNRDWPITDIDRFLLSKIEPAKITPADDTSSNVIKRRISYALTGLPPTPGELEKVGNRINNDLEVSTDPDESHLGNYVDQLLASNAFGERWARHWMDLVRYADSAGHEYDYEIEGAWRYRDYLVRAFNSDLPYDQFIREHLAGDLIPPRIVEGRNESLIATAWWTLKESPTAPVYLLKDEADYELAAKLQTSVPQLLELNQESRATLNAYGLNHSFEHTRTYGRQCLLARRLVEKGVRFVTVTLPRVHNDSRWDAHGELHKNHTVHALIVDQPIAALLEDLEQRGMMNDTFVVFATEFGRIPFSQGKDGRDHNQFGFSVWLAGAGILGGFVYGATDEFGYKAIENKLVVHDFHATILHLLGIEHTELTYRHGGRDYRLTDVHGKVVDEIFS